MIFLPEAADYIGESKSQSIELAETLEGETISKYRELAQRESVWLSVGGFHQKVALKLSLKFNRHSPKQMYSHSSTFSRSSLQGIPVVCKFFWGGGETQWKYVIILVNPYTCINIRGVTIWQCIDRILSCNSVCL